MMNWKLPFNIPFLCWIKIVDHLPTGMLIGGYIWGALGDAFGRRKILILAMFVNAFCGFGSSFCQDKESFITMRFFSGLG